MPSPSPEPLGHRPRPWLHSGRPAGLLAMAWEALVQLVAGRGGGGPPGALKTHALNERGCKIDQVSIIPPGGGGGNPGAEGMGEA